jgi:hypothetical protein
VRDPQQGNVVQVSGGRNRVTLNVVDDGRPADVGIGRGGRHDDRDREIGHGAVVVLVLEQDVPRALRGVAATGQ